MFKPMIEFCASNMHHGTDEIMDRMEQDDSFEVIEYGCLGNCGECYLKPFALVDGTIVAADSVTELYDRIIAAIKQQEADKDALDKLIDDL
ncbi:YuzB family protein [Paenibacillus sp. GSMTC-2017]|uniref:YuzB family protein n=1 Tax=Paenibacillus sp. GSMTC-2017 TaxID=2794350 RepID=UPI0018D83BD5|nr:YuzB family protein [Paenibacillus sp. GSMTC-2017]MBH5319210.1 YuzB family protein [Paenibacillus sp. GSMTC-2017]